MKVGKNNKLRASDIKKVVDAFVNRSDVAKFSKKVTREEIRNNEYNLNIPRYVDSSDSAEKWDIYASMFGGIPLSEIAELDEYWEAFSGLKEALFAVNGTPYTELAVADVASAIDNHQAIKAYVSHFAHGFASFEGFLKNELITNMASLNISKEEAVLSADMFARLATIPLVNSYEAYQMLDDQWTKTAVDLEIIQTEGFEAVKLVDPNMVIKKKDGKDEEVQDGWVGHVIPFDLVQQTLLINEYHALKNKESRLAEITAEYGEILDALSEEDKQSSAISENGEAFVPKEVIRILKEIKGTVVAEDSLEAALVRVGKLMAEEKDVRAQVKAEAAALHMKTKATIEALSNEQALALLEQKWILPLLAGIKQLPLNVISVLTDKVKTLAEKYTVTYAKVEADIRETEATLSSLIDELTGSEYDMKGLSELQTLLMGE